MRKYKMRRAVEEDNDDLVPLIDTNSKRLKEIYGSFYIAELLTRHKGTGRQIIVAEHKGVAIAVLILNKIINYKVRAGNRIVSLIDSFKLLLRFYSLFEYVFF